MTVTEKILAEARELAQQKRDSWPQPFDSADAGEIWQWQGYTLVLQKSPILHGYTCGRVETCLRSLTMPFIENSLFNTAGGLGGLIEKYIQAREVEKALNYDFLQQLQINYQNKFPVPPFSFFYAILAFPIDAKMIKNSSWPQAYAGLGALDFSLLQSYFDFRKKDGTGFSEVWKPLYGQHSVFSLFSKEGDESVFGGTHWNPYFAEVNQSSCRTHLFGEIQRHFNFTGSPIHVGSISTILG